MAIEEIHQYDKNLSQPHILLQLSLNYEMRAMSKSNRCLTQTNKTIIFWKCSTHSVLRFLALFVIAAASMNFFYVYYSFHSLGMENVYVVIREMLKISTGIILRMHPIEWWGLEVQISDFTSICILWRSVERYNKTFICSNLCWNLRTHPDKSWSTFDLSFPVLGTDKKNIYWHQCQNHKKDKWHVYSKYPYYFISL